MEEVRDKIRKSILERPLFSLVILLIAFVIYYFFGVSFNMDILSRVVMTLSFTGLLFYSFYNDIYSFSIVLLTGFSFFISLTISFGKTYIGDSLISLAFVFNYWIIFLISFLVSFLFFFWYNKSKSKEKYPLVLLVLYLIIWVILSVNVSYFHDWWLENLLTVPFVLILFFTYKKFRLSNLSYLLLFIFMTLHIVGTHYTYSEVPFGFWLQTLLSSSRNHYDRIVHFSFGLLLAYPIREISIRIGNFKGFWALYFPVDLVLAFSAIYELLEWGIVIVFGGDLGVAYLGTQGDVWDAQKDMFLAGLGSLIAMGLTFIFNILYKKGFLGELGKSLKVKK